MAEIGQGPRVSVVTRDAATDAFWAGRWSGMASALARALRNATAGEAELLAEYDRLAQMFESPPYFVASRPDPDTAAWIKGLGG
jgi:hypothetical protein